MKFKSRKIIVATIATSLVLGVAGASTSLAASEEVVPESISATHGDALTDVEPEAVPAIVGTAFVSGAATAAGAAVGDWVADRIIGYFDVQEDPLESSANLEQIFD